MKDVIELAKEAGASRYTNRHYPDRPTHTFTVDQLELYTKLVGNAKLEEAAQKAFSWNTAMTDTLAKEIRELKEPTP